jgi:putative acetyltransferase
MDMQDDISPVQPDDYPHVVEVWEASVRATHYFVSEADIQIFKPLVREGLPQCETLLCMRDADAQVVGFIGVE